ncbi:hypothetical protein [Lacticaseibacillus manihotivorans]|jgi:hypothetical protein|uniref:Uncharacterized protein n=2 Tax=Lacticaseibacillus manihotivorans TaxID=88233 RepID=A0A0R1QTI8_9LACO|nr:hypothetical protein [Lacticaseibacillus manihotivorans]KRL47569.1 hypothetical protein FD01_GL000232 [Lacticaseibacillus manihotivorans DSM 13343 = JCM 12514]QFQ92377.1 hypothetical protein LM010_13560 [Lacticaseibacillus manihotivorans]
MLLNELDVFTAQLEAINYPNIEAHTETGAEIVIHTNQKQREDPAFWQSIRAILKAQLWVPVSKTWHQLSDSDWLAPSPAI